MMEMVANPMPVDGADAQKGPVSNGLAGDPHATHINAQLEEFRKQLLGMTLRNNLLNCPHGPSVLAQVRIVDELPDAVFERLEKGHAYTFLPLPEPRDLPDDEDSDEFRDALDGYQRNSLTYRAAIPQLSARKDKDAALAQAEREARDYVRSVVLHMDPWKPEHGLGPEELSRRRGIDPSFDLPASDQAEAVERHHDNALQTLLPDETLAARLSRLRDRARSSLSQTGVGTLYAAFGFLEWFESDDSDLPRLAPLVLMPAELVRELQRGLYRYRLGGSGDDAAEKATENVTLALHLRQNFGLELPKLHRDDSLESYFTKVTEEVCNHRRRWRVRRFLTVGIFAYSKLAIYEDLNPLAWPDDQALAAHENIRTLMAQSGVADIPYAENRAIDEDETSTASPFLIYDADSSQHSAITDVLAGKNLTIYGPPGTGKSQTIANTIAAAAMAGKTVLFVAEKLTALDVVRDRLVKAGLGSFCCNLHAQGLKSDEVKRSLEERITMSRPDFDLSRYEREKESWTKQRDGLKTYASIMGKQIGQLEETVHDILWRAIARRSSETNLPPSIAALQIAHVDTATASEIGEARNRIKVLQNAHAEVRRLVGESRRSPWRGLRRTDLAPVEVGSSLYLIEIWEVRLAELEDEARQHGLSGDVRTISELRTILQGVEILEQFSDAATCCDLASLTGHETRNQIFRATERSRRLQRFGEELIGRFEIAPEQLPNVNDLRELTGSASSLGVTDLSTASIRSQAQALREKADMRDSVDDTLARLGSCLEFDTTLDGADETVERAFGLLREAPNDLLSARIDSLVTHDAGRTLERAESELQQLKETRKELAVRFDLGSLPASEELRMAARTLNAARGPLLFNKPAKRAMALHRELSLNRAKLSSSEAAKDFRALADYRERADRLDGDTEIALCLGSHWRGIETNLAQARRVGDWSARVHDRLAGAGEGRIKARTTLLSGQTDRLVEFRQLAETFPANWRDIRAELDPADAREQADRLDALADTSATLGLNGALPLSRAGELADLVQAFQSLSAEARADETLARVFPSQDPDLETLEDVHALATAMSGAGLPDLAWDQAVELFVQTPDTERARQVLGDDIVSGEEAWSQCVETLWLDELTFLDGKCHEATPISVLRERARECQDARNTLLPWSAYQRARTAVTQGHAAPVLAAFDQHDIPVTQFEEAYEWALYRSLATVLYRRYPELNELSSWQLSNHRTAFQELEDRLQELERSRIAHELHSRSIEHGVSFGGPSAFTEKALIQNQIARQGKGLGITVRNLFGRAGTALRQLKPCFMMSPTSVAELLPRDSDLFDIVIVDEASQMLPCDALGTIARAKQTVIVGDPKQLPPSTYFQGGGMSTAVQDDEGDQLAPVMESILDLSLSAWQPPRYLQWHYRSRHSSLIQFSNARFYNNRLIVFPGADENREDSGIRFHHVADGLYSGGLNPIEAKRVVTAACDFMKKPENRDLSLAIVAMNQRQRDEIREMLDRETARDRSVARYRRRWRNSLYPFIVRNLETVQGDERDVIFISTVYGREQPGGPVMRRFGPITHAGGERRLNVLFSRARQRMEVFSSMQANDIAVGPGISEGVRILRDYLEYAATGRIEVGIVRGPLTESPFEEFVLERLRAEGLEVDPQVGVAGYRIDLGIRHADYPHGYLLGIECDGRTYHSAPSVRDRDRLRETVLRGLGWDIYRIWSTDWFKDPDEEMRKLMTYVEARMEAWRAGDESGVGEARLLGEVVERSVQAFTNSVLMKSEVQSDNGPVCVEVGDTVSYQEVGRNGDVRRVSIVQGVDDPANGVISDDRPLAMALLGAEVGETVAIGQSPTEFNVVVAEIERPDVGRDDQPASRSFAAMEGIELAPYPEWRGQAPDPRSASLAEVAETLSRIVAVEAPVLVDRAYQAYIQGCAAQRLGPQIRRALNRALASLERRNSVVVERASDGSGFRNALICSPTDDSTLVREIGPRTFDEVPFPELSALIRVVRASKPEAPTAEIYRQILGLYGLVRMTAQIRKRFEEADGFVTH